MTLTTGDDWGDYLQLSYVGSENSGEATISSWEWDFGDDSDPVTGPSGTHTYEETGTYPVSLSVTFSGGGSETIDKSIIISEPQIVASASVTKEDELTVSFESTTEGATSWEWDFGEDNTGDIDKTTESGEYTYSKPGTYTVTLTAKRGEDNHGDWKDEVTVSSSLDPTAYFIIDEDMGTAKGSSPLYVKFIDKSTPANSSSNARIKTWKWDFDGAGKETITRSSDVTDGDVEHIFRSKGEYTVTLTVKDYAGHEATYEYDSIEVVAADDAPEAKFALYKDYTDYGVAPFTVKFEDLSEESDLENDLDEWYWELYDDENDEIDVITKTSSSSTDPEFELEEAGKYTVRLTVIDDDGYCSTFVKSDMIEVTSTLSATFTASPASGTAPLSVSFTANPGDYNIDKYVWNFGSGEGTGTGKTVSHTYSSAGTYKVTLTVYEGSKSYTTPAKSIAVSKKAATTTKATYVIETTASPTATANLAQLSSGTKIFGLPGTEFFRDEIERFYDFYKEYTSLIAGLFGSGK